MGRIGGKSGGEPTRCGGQNAGDVIIDADVDSPNGAAPETSVIVCCLLLLLVRLVPRDATVKIVALLLFDYLEHVP